MVLQVSDLGAMKIRRRSGPYLPWKAFFLFILILVFVSGFTFSTLQLFFREGFRPKLVSSWRNSAVKAVSGDLPVTPSISVRQTVILPDQALIFLKYPLWTPLFTKDDINCTYYAPNSSQPELELPPVRVDDDYRDHQIVRCQVDPRGLSISVAVKSNGNLVAGPSYRWDSLAYEALIDYDNTTIVFVKGFNLRPGRASNPSRFECVYGWDFSRPKFLLRSPVVSIAQEIVRCETPLSILNKNSKEFADSNGKTIKVSVRMIGGGILNSIAQPNRRYELASPAGKQHEMCICTMLRNQARFIREWVTYHAGIGVQRWFVYDNNSEDEIEAVVESLIAANFNITRHAWPWIKTQESGFAHCALRARRSCKWVGFIDADEFFHFPTGLSLLDIVRNQSRRSEVAEIRASCYSFGPSRRRTAPRKGVTAGYTCRMSGTERHKSIVKPEALNENLMNAVHHFHLKKNFEHVEMDASLLVINHYKYQVWEVFKEKFYRRVATYVSDWQLEENVGSRDRTPGLGTRAVEPPDWATRFCQVWDRGLKDRVVQTFTDPRTGMLPWQTQEEEEESDDRFTMVTKNTNNTTTSGKGRRRRIRRGRALLSL